MIDVSRQAVSKWELGESYPEVEKLLLLSHRLHISLDSLMSAEMANEPGVQESPVTGRIVIASPNENVVVTCCKVLSSQRMKGGKRSPKYALYGVGDGGKDFFGESTTFLAWYADHDSLTKEVSEIRQALLQGIPFYEFHYSVKTERKWLRIRMADES